MIESVLPIPASPRVARVRGMRPFITVALGRVDSGVPPRPLVIQLEGEEGAVLELVNVEDLTVSVSARYDANHAGNSTPGRFLCLKLRVNNRSPVLRKEERGQVLSGQGSTYFPKPAVRPAAAWSGRVAMTNELITLAGQTARGSFAG